MLRRRSKGAKIRSSDSDEEKRDDSLGKEGLEDLGDETVNPSFAPDTPVGPDACKDGGGSTEAMAPSEQLRFVLLDVARKMCTKPNRRFADMDILEIAAMKGIYFPPPSWWRPGGYEKVRRFLGNLFIFLFVAISVLGAISDVFLLFLLILFAETLTYGNGVS